MKHLKLLKKVERLIIENLKDVGKTFNTTAWIFSQGYSGGSRGCYKSVNVKLWEEV